MLHQFCEGGKREFVIATHSPIIMAYPDSWIYDLADAGPVRVPYEETEHFSRSIAGVFGAIPCKCLICC